MRPPKGTRRVTVPTACVRRVKALAETIGTFSGGIVAPDYMPADTFDMGKVGLLRLVREAGPGYADRHVVNGPADVVAMLAPRWSNAPVESLLVLLLDCRHAVIGGAPVELSRGTVNSCYAEPRDVFRVAVLAGAFCVVLAHNHPSGDPTPSPDDIRVTRLMSELGVMMSIPVVDHIVIGAEGRFCSLTEMGLI